METSDCKTFFTLPDIRRAKQDRSLRPRKTRLLSLLRTQQPGIEEPDLLKRDWDYLKSMSFFDETRPSATQLAKYTPLTSFIPLSFVPSQLTL